MVTEKSYGRKTENIQIFSEKLTFLAEIAFILAKTA